MEKTNAKKVVTSTIYWKKPARTILYQMGYLTKDGKRIQGKNVSDFFNRFLCRFFGNSNAQEQYLILMKNELQADRDRLESEIDMVVGKLVEVRKMNQERKEKILQIQR